MTEIVYCNGTSLFDFSNGACKSLNDIFSNLSVSGHKIFVITGCCSSSVDSYKHTLNIWESNSRDYPYHKYVWERDEFCSKLEEIGFQIVLSTGATKSHVPFRDMAVICQKPLAPNKKILSKNSKYWKKKYGNFLSRIFIQLKSITKLFLLSLR